MLPFSFSEKETCLLQAPVCPVLGVWKGTPWHMFSPPPSSSRSPVAPAVWPAAGGFSPSVFPVSLLYLFFSEAFLKSRFLFLFIHRD